MYLRLVLELILAVLDRDLLMIDDDQWITRAYAKLIASWQDNRKVNAYNSAAGHSDINGDESWDV